MLFRNPVPVEEIEGLSTHALCVASFYALDIVDRKNVGAVCPSVKGAEEEVIVDQVKVPQRPFAIARINT